MLNQTDVISFYIAIYAMHFFAAAAIACKTKYIYLIGMNNSRFTANEMKNCMHQLNNTTKPTLSVDAPELLKFVDYVFFSQVVDSLENRAL